MFKHVFQSAFICHNLGIRFEKLLTTLWPKTIYPSGQIGSFPNTQILPKSNFIPVAEPGNLDQKFSICLQNVFKYNKYENICATSIKIANSHISQNGLPIQFFLQKSVLPLLPMLATSLMNRGGPIALDFRVRFSNFRYMDFGWI